MDKDNHLILNRKDVDYIPMANQYVAFIDDFSEIPESISIGQLSTFTLKQKGQYPYYRSLYTSNDNHSLILYKGVN